MYKFIDLLFNFNTGKKINFERSVIWGIILCFFLTKIFLLAL